MEWQPIETAPKDGTYILGWTGSYCDHMKIAVWKWKDSTNPMWCRWISVADHEYIDQPTHWMALPPPPEAT